MPKFISSLLWTVPLLVHLTSGCTSKESQAQTPHSNDQPNRPAARIGDNSPAGASPASPSQAPNRIGDFVVAAKAATPAVVHIKTTYNAPTGYGQAAGQGYGPSTGRGTAMGSGSGIIVSPDGYIATNNHVVENASGMQVVLPNKQTYPAELVGRDPNTDLALLKIKAANLPAIQFGNSDSVQVGEWVVAVGYPFSLNTTVTAGIVSAKARSIGIINRPSRGEAYGAAGSAGNTGVESFIQTDAAINPGNSGGALVNTAGELVGVNSAIASQTGSYAGYAFAIPVNLAKKILNDLKEYGAVRRGVLGVAFPAPAAEDQYLLQQGLKPGAVPGVYITGVQPNSAAAAAGLREGDIIQRLDGVALTSSAEFSELIARHAPGDALKLAYQRQGKTNTVTVTLKAEPAARPAAEGPATLGNIYDKLGARFAPVPNALKQQFRLNSGVLVTDVRQGGFFHQIGVPSNTIIAFINGQPIGTVKDIEAALLSAQRGMIQMLAIAPDGSRVVFDFSLGT
ncbi:trypsin-like peptidase domain-containing protein [Hymenobacter sp. YC55]|uniref:trypsin-like peptidase domain-containing protein n=1 Tax=Hymenobacter sp. YC55 TaxID=3034019 RepID=UPI0023F758D4|nr:trypsin-like peptidase domain-containing protein [Hymenobacter sp. YC55]MDF7813857.1 trypsin-like peptidase domain-containing protein [Hymenobacter sp. YC55]